MSRDKAGSTIRVEGAFDNSIKNPFNPNPFVPINFGYRSTDEMFIGYIAFSYVNSH